MSETKIGIYKITNPKGKIYIGQSVNILDRKSRYSKCNCSAQPIISNSIKKYGWENHIFEIIEECSVEQLDEREIYWGLYYDTLGKNGLNCRLGAGKGICSEETKLKIGNSNKGIPKPKGFGEMVSINNKGNKFSNESKQKISDAKTGHICYDNPERGKLISNALKGRKLTWHYKPVLQFDLDGNYLNEYPSIKEAANSKLGLCRSSIGINLNGKTRTSGGFIWKWKII